MDYALEASQCSIKVYLGSICRDFYEDLVSLMKESSIVGKFMKEKIGVHGLKSEFLPSYGLRRIFYKSIS